MISDTDSQLLQELKPTEQKESLCNNCCQRLSSLGLRMEMSQRATGVAWGAIPEYLLAKVREVTIVPCFPELGASGKCWPSRGGPIRRAHFLSRPSSAPQPWAQLLGSHTIALVWPLSTCGLCRRGQASGQPLLLFLLGEGAGSDSSAPG